MKPNVFCGARAVISYFGSEKKLQLFYHTTVSVEDARRDKKLHLFYHTNVSVEDARRDKKFNNKFKFLKCGHAKKTTIFFVQRQNYADS